MKFGLPNKTINILQEFFACFPEIEKVNIYGSRAKGNFDNGSDVDLAFYAKTDKMMTGQLLTEINELPVPYLFDIIDYNRITHLPLKEHIDRVGKVLYSKAGKRKSKCCLPRKCE